MVRSRPSESEIQPPRICRASGTTAATVKASPTCPTLAPSSRRYSGIKAMCMWLAMLASTIVNKNHRISSLRRGRRSGCNVCFLQGRLGCGPAAHQESQHRLQQGGPQFLSVGSGLDAELMLDALLLQCLTELFGRGSAPLLPALPPPLTPP